MQATVFFLLLIAATSMSWGAVIDEQIAILQAKSDSLQREAWTLESQKEAARLDLLFQADSTLRADMVRVAKAWASPEWVKIALDKLTDLDRKIVRAELKVADLSFQATSSPDTLYMRRDRAEKALPVISAALKE